MKVCRGCQQEKSIEYYNFSNKTKGTRRAHCKDCTRKWGREHFHKNKQYYVRKATDNHRKSYWRNQQIICEYLLLHPCVDCGEKDIVVLEFDHQHDKEFAISMVANKSVEKLLAEITKCVVRCANCHRRKTAKQFGHFRTRYVPMAQSDKASAFEALDYRFESC